MKLLHNTPESYAKTDWKVAIATGLSDPTCCHLSVDQHEFRSHLLQRIHSRESSGLTENEKQERFLDRNFPYLKLSVRKGGKKGSENQESLERVLPTLGNLWQANGVGIRNRLALTGSHCLLRQTICC